MNNVQNKTVETCIIAIMCFILTIGICIQINTVNNNGSTVTGTQAENNLKSQVLKMKEKYENQYAQLEEAEKELERVRQEISSGNTELVELEEKIKKANILLGKTNVTGSGVAVTLTDGINDATVLEIENLIIHDENVLKVVNEMKNAGAEAISINGERIVNSTPISCDGNVIIVNGNKITSPIQITAIGLTELLSTLSRPGGTLEYYKNLGKGVEIRKMTNVEIPKYSGVMTFKYASTVK